MIKAKCLSRSIGLFQIFLGLGAVSGGLGLVLKPDGSNLGMSVDMLAHSPFPDFLIPGIVLLTVNGFGNLAGSAASFLSHRRAAEIAMALGVFLMAWIVMQVYWLGLTHWLQPLYFVFGAAEASLGVWLRKKIQNRDYCSTDETN